MPSDIVNIDKRQVEFYGSPGDLDLPSGIVYPYSSSFEIFGVPIVVAGLFQPPEER